MQLRTQGLVLRSVPYKEADSILTVLARGEGRLTVSARGARSKGYRFAAAVQLLSYTDMSLFHYKGRHRLDDAELLNAFLPLRGDLELLALGSYAGELAEALSPEGLSADELLDLTLNTLYALCRWPEQRLRLKAAFEFRALCLTGYTPWLDGCAVCGLADPEDGCLHLHHGQLHCRSCRGGLPAGGLSLPLTPGALGAMRYVAGCGPKRLFSFILDGGDLDVFSDVCEAYAHAQLERGFRTLDFYKKIKIAGLNPGSEEKRALALDSPPSAGNPKPMP